MNEDLPRLDDDLSDLLAAERERGPAPEEEAEAVLERVTATLGEPPRGGGQSPSGGQGAGARGLVDFARSRAGAWALGAFVAGVAGGAWLRGEVAPRIVVVERPAPAATIAPAIPAPLATELAGTALSDLPDAVPKPAAHGIKPSNHPLDGKPANANANESAKDTRLAAERALVETGRTALARGDYTSAIAALDRHANTFADGQLAEEREVLFVRALVAGGRMKEATQRGAGFRLKYPDSVMLPVVDEALR